MHFKQDHRALLRSVIHVGQQVLF
jgi:hypothetical protein